MSMMSEQQGIRKAAVFLNGLDKEAAGMLLKRLPEKEARAIRREMVAIAGISPSEINKTVRQFLKDTKYDLHSASKTNVNQHANNAHKTVFSGDGDLFELSGTPERLGPLGWPGQMSQAQLGLREQHEHCENHVAETTPEHEPPKPPVAPIVAETPAEPRRFDYLERRSALETAGFLAEEGEQLIAVVLSQMMPRYSGDVLACFEQSLKRDLIRRLARLDATDETILDEIDTVLKDRLKREVEDRPKNKPGLALLEQILQVVDNELGNDVDNNISNDIISGLNEIDMEEQQAEYECCDQYGDEGNAGYTTAYEYPWPAEEVEAAWTFEDLGMLEDHELGVLFGSLDRDLVVKSLMGCDAYFVGRVLGLFPVYEQVSLREMLQHATSMDAMEQDYARQCVMSGLDQQGDSWQT